MGNLERVFTPPPPAGLEGIDEQELDAPGSFDFQDIPPDYIALRLVLSLRGNSAAAFAGLVISLNGDNVDANYHHQRLQGTAAAASALENLGAANSRNIGLIPADTALAGAFAALELIIPAYAKADRLKTYELRNAASWGILTGTHISRQITALWRNLAPVNRIVVAAAAGGLVAGSRASLYGIRSSFR